MERIHLNIEEKLRAERLWRSQSRPKVEIFKSFQLCEFRQIT